MLEENWMKKGMKQEGKDQKGKNAGSWRSMQSHVPRLKKGAFNSSEFSAEGTLTSVSILSDCGIGGKQSAAQADKSATAPLNCVVYTQLVHLLSAVDGAESSRQQTVNETL